MDQSFQTLANAVLSADDFHGMAGQIVEALQRLAGIEAAYVTRIDTAAGTQRILSARHRDEVLNREGETIEWRRSLCAYALASGEVLIRDPASRWPDAVGSTRHGVQRYLCYPVQTSDGQLFGTLCGLDRQPDSRERPDLQPVLALFSGLLTRQLQREAHGGDGLKREAADALAASDLTLFDRLTKLSHSAENLPSAVTVLASLEHERGRWSRAVPFYCIEGQPEASWVGENPIVAHLAAVLGDHQPDQAMCGDQEADGLVTLDANLISTQRLRVEAGLRARGTSVLVKAATADGLEGGVVLLADKLTPLHFGEAWLLRHGAEHLSLLAENLKNRHALAETTAQLERTATRDSLTGLRNRRYLIEELARILAQADRLGETIHVAFLNLDGFKAINDNHGHQAGDQLLIGIAQRLHRATRASDIVARYGGDEFVVVGPGIKPGNAEHERQRFGERLEATTTGHYDLGSVGLDYEGPSIGVTTSEPGDMDPDRLLALAEEAMYAVKEERRWNRRWGSSATV